MAEWEDILDGGKLLHEPSFCTHEEADALFDWLRTEVPWWQEAAHGHPLPRLNAWFADAGLRYSYSGLSHLASAGCPS